MADAADIEWQQILEDMSFNADILLNNWDSNAEVPDQSGDLDQWLNSNLSPNSFPDGSKDQQILSPPLFAGFIDQNKGHDGVSASQSEFSPPQVGTSEVELRCLVQSLQSQLEDKAGRIDCMNDYLGELQLWIHEISDLVNGLMEKQQNAVSFSSGAANQVLPDSKDLA
ncbi:hypothetical protein ABVK25_010810 [Lepraria finkii]|uniref:Uncharacterized protein n=1 Tax=Lepraria finkii TaxID=1340010 RepID=A0ABR4ATD3_9LECA